MNIQSIQLENWKKFTNPVKIELKKGLNIIHGPNESGKSTLIDSIITTFYFKHTSNSQKIKSLKPWGTSLHPQSTIIFSKNGSQYRITKGFQDKNSLLEKLNQEQWMKIAEGDEADKLLIKVVGGIMPTRGDTKPEYWGLGQILWMVQGTPIIQDELNDETRSSLQKMVGTTIESREEKIVLNQIKSRFLENFSPKKKELKNKSNLGQLKEEIAKLQEELMESKSNITRKENIIRSLEDIEILFDKNKSILKTAKEEESKMALMVDEANEHQRIRESLENEILKLQNDYSLSYQRIEDINNAQEQIEKIVDSNNEINLLLEPLKKENDELNQKMEDDNTAIRNLDQKISEHLQEKKIAGIAHTAVIDEQTLDEKKIQIKEINDLKMDLLSTKEKFDSILVPDSDEFSKIEGLSQDIRDAETSLKAIGLKIKAKTSNKMSGDIYLDQEKNSFILENNTQTWTAHQSLKVQIEGLGEIEVTSGSQDVKGLKEKLENLKNQYQELLDPYPTSDLSELKSLMSLKATLKTDLKWLENQLTRKSKKSEETISKEILILENRIKANWDKIPDESEFKECEGKDKHQVRQALSEKINLMEEVISQLQKNRQQINDILENDRNTIKKTTSMLVDLKTQLHGNSQRQEEIEKTLSKLTEDDKSMKDRENELNQLSLKIQQKERAWKVYQDEIDTKEIKPLKAFEGLKKKVEMLDGDLRKLEINRAGMQRELTLLTAQSTDTNIIEERLAKLSQKEKELETETEAIKLLYNLTSFYQEKTISNLSGPLESRVSEDLERLLGPKYTLKFDTKMKPESIDTGDQEATLNLLSFGTQEQIWCLFRLALGSILSNGEKQLVVLDDPLVNTDPVRMHHSLEILEENASHMQIIVVTCDVSKYNSLSDANFISMDETV